MDSSTPISFNAPPVITPPSAPAPRRGGRGWKIFAIILIVILLISLVMNLQFFVGGLVKMPGTTYTAGPVLEEILIEDNRSRNKIAVIDVEGIITSQPLDHLGNSMVKMIKYQLDRAAADDRVRAVLLRVNSPGGEVLASDDINREIAKFQKENRKPVIASMQGLAASGGYYVSAPCRWIVANDLTITGSIGVIMSGWNYRGLMDKVGVRPEVYKSGRFKDMLSGSRPPEEISPEERAMVQELIDNTFEKFKEVVAEGRGRASQLNGSEGRQLSNDWSEYADGRILTGEQAYDLGFVDELGNLEAAVARAEELANISSANLVKYQQRFDLASLLGILGKSESRAIKVDLGFEGPKLQAGQLYFLSPTFLH